MSRFTEQLHHGRVALNFCTVDYSDPANYLTRRNAIRMHCAACFAGNVAEVRTCPCKTCPLWPFRNGKDPRTAGRPSPIQTPEQRAAVADRLRAARSKAR